jgi:hypothetical protein
MYYVDEISIPISKIDQPCRCNCRYFLDNSVDVCTYLLLFVDIFVETM